MKTVTVISTLPIITGENVTEEQMRTVMRDATEDVVLQFENLEELERLSLNPRDLTIRKSLSHHLRKRYNHLRRSIDNSEAAGTTREDNKRGEHESCDCDKHIANNTRPERHQGADANRHETKDVCLQFENLEELERLSLNPGDQIIRTSLIHHLRRSIEATVS
ncbi:hypothetical protein WMY93_001887 [Mugilogobius chulae]|uniref:Uncharacterized protein n=1 Tax=Mugilogobius chulae TaxID=88201 RepID=A0AAW0PS36_9GOBI